MIPLVRTGRPGTALFWGILAAGSMAGVVTAAALGGWMTHRGFACWPLKEAPGETGHPRLPSLKTAWSVLLGSAILIACAFGGVLAVVT